MNSLLVNLSFLIAKPTGHTAYAVNLLPHLQSLNPTLLISPLAPNPLAPFPRREGGMEGEEGKTIDTPLLVGEGLGRGQTTSAPKGILPNTQLTLPSLTGSPIMSVPSKSGN